MMVLDVFQNKTSQQSDSVFAHLLKGKCFLAKCLPYLKAQAQVLILNTNVVWGACAWELQKCSICEQKNTLHIYI